MSFSYCHKFKLWKPIAIEDTDSITQIKDIRRVEK